jgi:lipopolysaccharide/colanic/teichoic acid biosynthesis glycosyltransferase
VVVALTDAAPEALVHQLMHLRFSGVRVYGIADFYEQMWFKVPVLHTRHGWLVFAHGFDLLHNPLGLRIKRLLDAILAMVLLVVTLPLMLVVAILIKLESRGPVIFRQARTGLGGSEFEVLKFRSMTHDAERDGPQWTQQSDPRITRLGRVMRLLHIDELPQLVNVLKGEMSFVGPRPERPVFNATLENEIPLYNLRHLVRPGITGWAQVMYPYAPRWRTPARSCSTTSTTSRTTPFCWTSASSSRRCAWCCWGGAGNSGGRAARGRPLPREDGWYPRQCG